MASKGVGNISGSQASRLARYDETQATKQQKALDLAGAKVGASHHRLSTNSLPAGIAELENKISDFKGTERNIIKALTKKFPHLLSSDIMQYEVKIDQNDQNKFESVLKFQNRIIKKALENDSTFSFQDENMYDKYEQLSSDLMMIKQNDNGRNQELIEKVMSRNSALVQSNLEGYNEGKNIHFNKGTIAELAKELTSAELSLDKIVDSARTLLEMKRVTENKLKTEFRYCGSSLQAATDLQTKYHDKKIQLHSDDLIKLSGKLNEYQEFSDYSLKQVVETEKKLASMEKDTKDGITTAKYFCGNDKIDEISSLLMKYQDLKINLNQTYLSKLSNRLNNISLDALVLFNEFYNIGQTLNGMLEDTKAQNKAGKNFVGEDKLDEISSAINKYNEVKTAQQAKYDELSKDPLSAVSQSISKTQ